MARQGEPPLYPRYPLREFTPCAPGRCIQQDFQVSSRIEPSIQFLQCDFHPRRVTQVTLSTTDLTDLTDNMRITRLNKSFPYPCHNLSHSSRSAKNSQFGTASLWRTVTAGKPGGYVMLRCAGTTTIIHQSPHREIRPSRPILIILTILIQTDQSPWQSIEPRWLGRPVHGGYIHVKYKLELLEYAE